MIEDRIEHETVDASAVTSSKPSEFSHADYCYVVALTFFSSSESLKFFIIVHQVTPNISSFSECLELFPNFDHIFVGPSDVILLAISDLHSPKKLIYLFVLPLRVLLSESVALRLSDIHDEICRQIIIYNDYYKFPAYPLSIYRNL